MVSFVAFLSVWKRESLEALCFMFTYLISLLPCCSCLFARAGVGACHWNKRSTITHPIQHPLQASKIFTKSPLVISSLLLDLANCCHFCVCLIAIIWVCLESLCFKGCVLCVSGLMCFVSLLHFCSCLFTRARSRSLLLKQEEHHHLLSSMLASNEQDTCEITLPCLFVAYVWSITIVLMCLVAIMWICLEFFVLHGWCFVLCASPCSPFVLVCL